MAAAILYSLEYKIKAPIDHGVPILYSLESQTKAPIQHDVCDFVFT